MLSFSAYKILHLFGLFMMFVALGGACFLAVANSDRTKEIRRMVAMLHGIGGLVSLIAGFAMLGAVNMSDGFPGWVIAKLALWVLLAGLLAVPHRKRSLAGPIAFALPVLGLLGAYFAIIKPF